MIKHDIDRTTVSSFPSQQMQEGFNAALTSDLGSVSFNCDKVAGAAEGLQSITSTRIAKAKTDIVLGLMIGCTGFGSLASDAQAASNDSDQGTDRGLSALTTTAGKGGESSGSFNIVGQAISPSGSTEVSYLDGLQNTSLRTTLNDTKARVAPCEVKNGFDWDDCRNDGSTAGDYSLGTALNGRLELRCIKDYYLYWIESAENEKLIGMCRYRRGENQVTICWDQSHQNILQVELRNLEGHVTLLDTREPLWAIINDSKGRDPKRYEADYSHYDTASDTLTVRKNYHDVDLFVLLIWPIPHPRERPYPSEVKRPELIYQGPPLPEEQLEKWFRGLTVPPGPDGQFTQYGSLDGTALAGHASLLVLDQTFTVSLVGGESADQVADSLAALVNADSNLRNYGITAVRSASSAGIPTTLELKNVDMGEWMIVADGQGAHGLSLLNMNEPAKLHYQIKDGRMELTWMKWAPGVILELSYQLGKNAEWERVEEQSPQDPTNKIRTASIGLVGNRTFLRLRIP